MKRTFLGLLLLLSITAYSQENKGLARVKKVSGVEVYVYAEPLREYEIKGTVTSESLEEIANAVGTANKVMEGTDRASDVRCYSMSERIKFIVRNAMKKKNAKKNPIDFDAIIIDDDKSGTLIKFIDE